MTQTLAFPQLGEARQLAIPAPAIGAPSEDFRQRLASEFAPSSATGSHDSRSTRDVRSDREDAAPADTTTDRPEESSGAVPEESAVGSDGASDARRSGSGADDDAVENRDATVERAGSEDADKPVESEQGAAESAGVETVVDVPGAAVVASQVTAADAKGGEGEKAATKTAHGGEGGESRVASARTANVTVTADPQSADGDASETGEQSDAGDRQSQRNDNGSFAASAKQSADAETSDPTSEPPSPSLATEASRASQQGDASDSESEPVLRTVKSAPAEPAPIRTSGQVEKPTLMQSASARSEPTAIRAEVADDRASVASAQRGLAAAVRQNGGSITIKMVPESLGALRIQMSINGGAVDVRFDAATEQAREILHRNIESLRQSLTSKGLGVERLQVTLQPNGQESLDSRHGGDRQAGHDQQRQQEWGDERSRGFHDRRGSGEHSGRQWGQESGGFDNAWRVAVNTTA